MFLRTLSRQSAGIKITMLSLLTASLLSGCGIRGGLKTPPPLFGGATKVDPERVPGADFDKREVEDDDLFIADPFIDDPAADPFADDPLAGDPQPNTPATDN